MADVEGWMAGGAGLLRIQLSVKARYGLLGTWLRGGVLQWGGVYIRGVKKDATNARMGEVNTS